MKCTRKGNEVWQLFSLEIVFNILEKEFMIPEVISYCLTNKESSTVLCSVVKQAGSGRARKKCRGNTRRSRVFFPTS